MITDYMMRVADVVGPDEEPSDPWEECVRVSLDHFLSAEEVHAHAKKVIDDWNLDQLFPLTRTSDSLRSLVGVTSIRYRLFDEHDWEKKNLVTEVRGGAFIDRLQCSRCGVKAERHGLSRIVVKGRNPSTKCYGKRKSV